LAAGTGRPSIPHGPKRATVSIREIEEAHLTVTASPGNAASLPVRDALAALCSTQFTSDDHAT
jgi:hypothetical protein